MASSISLLAKEWVSQFSGRKNLALRICSGCYGDLLIDPRRYGFDGPMWFARIVEGLFPSPDLWILLDSVTGSGHSEMRESIPEQTNRRIEAYLTFVRAKRNYVILDASQSVQDVTDISYAAIIDALAQRAEKRVKSLL
jgi:hypothetical protein